jgi:ABC-type thiamin/hydroxymethylpyrimidine transport system permease subunit
VGGILIVVGLFTWVVPFNVTFIIIMVISFLFLCGLVGSALRALEEDD